MLARDSALAAILAALPGLAVSGLAHGQGLGEITLNSSLNEPLDATIPLFQLGGLDESQLRVGMASENDFARSDIPRPDFLRNIQFTLEIDGDTGVLHLRSETPVVEPYLNFLVDARWPSGRMLREYTVLLDLPTFSQAAAAPVQPAARTAPEPVAADREPVARAAQVDRSAGGRAQQASTPSETAAQPPAGVMAQAAPAAIPAPGEERSVTVAPNDTLWQIAAQNRPDNAVSVQQMMLAIQRANEGAFIDGNINGLRTGEVLRIPGIDEVLAVNRAQAYEEVALQNSRFATDALDAQPLVGGGRTSGAAAPSAGDELSVLTAGDDAQDLGARSNDLDARVAELETALMLSEENLDRVTLENEELRSRLADLEAQIETLQNIIAIEDQRLAQLQAELAAQAEAAAQVAAAPAEPAAPQPVAEPVAAPATAAAAAPGAGLQTMLNGLLRNPLVMGGGLAILVLLVLGFLIWRRRKDEQDRGEEDSFSRGAEASRLSPAAPGVASAAATAATVAVDAPDAVADEEAAVSGNEDTLQALGNLMETSGAGQRDKLISTGFDDTQVPDWLSEDPGYSFGEEETPDVSLEDMDADLDAQAAEFEAGMPTPEDEEASSLELDDSAGEDGALAFDEADAAGDAFSLDSEESGAADDAFSLGSEEPGAGDDVFHLDDADQGDVADDVLAEDGAELAETNDDAFTLDADDALDLGDVDTLAQVAAEVQDEEELPVYEEESLDLSLGDDEELVLETEEAAPTAAAVVEGVDFRLERSEVMQSAAQADTGEIESFEFRLDEPAQPAAAPAPTLDSEVESFDFRLEDAPTEQAEASSAEDGAETMETFDFTLDDSPVAGTLDVAIGDGTEAADAAGFQADDAASASRAEDDFDLDLDLGNLDLDEALMRVDEELRKAEEEGADTDGPLTDRDEVSTKLDLAVAYEAMGDLEGALEILDEVIAEGSEAQIGEARELKSQWSQTEAGE